MLVLLTMAMAFYVLNNYKLSKLELLARFDKILVYFQSLSFQKWGFYLAEI